jgi:ABC-type transporter Mla maintaining outer membrane lipid asymmetry ATPase subunit MlaF
MLIAGSTQARLKVHLKLTSIVVTHDTHLAERLADDVLFLDRSKILFYGTVGEMKRSPEPLVQEFLRDDQQEFHFSDEEEETMAVGKEQRAREVKVPCSERRGD